MTAEKQDSEYYKLDNQYRMTPYTGQNCSMIMRDIDNKIRAVVNVCDNKISSVSGYDGERVSTSGRRALIKFIKRHNYRLTLSAARDLGLTIYHPASGGESYLDEKELVALLEQSDISGATIIVHHFKRREMRIKSATKGAVLNLSRAEIKKLVIGKNCNLMVDLRENPYVQTLDVKEGFAGQLNLSRSGLTDILISDNCRCDMRINDSMNCFNLMIGDVFSGSLNIKNSCFHDLDIGYYSYASINLDTNWGRRRIKIGNSFRGELLMNNIHVPDIKIGDDCKGKIIRMDSDNLALLKTPTGTTSKIMIEKELPEKYFTPFYVDWYKNVKVFFREKLRN